MTYSLPLFAIQKALDARLAAGVVIAGVAIPVYDAVPDNAAFPYLTLGEDTANDRSPKGYQVTDCTHTLHVWSRQRGFRECKQIMDQAIQALTVTPLDLSADGYGLVELIPEFTTVMMDPDGLTRHGVVRLRLVVSS